MHGGFSGRVQMGQRAVIYCRVSTADQSCVRQKDELKRFAERAGYEVLDVFMETGSGVRRGNLTEGLYIGLDYEKVCFAKKNFS
ncbi:MULTISPECIES: recombinase family protein [Acetobacter]|uniref:recombinase family protein n=1 Tax=Acetobacter TaxID=434 RepID=UPI0037700028